MPLCLKRHELAYISPTILIVKTSSIYLSIIQYVGYFKIDGFIPNYLRISGYEDYTVLIRSWLRLLQYVSNNCFSGEVEGAIWIP